MPGFILNHAVVPDKDLAVIALGNGESYSVFAVTNKILDLYLGNGKADPVADMLPGIQRRNDRNAKRWQARAAARVPGTSPSVEAPALVGTYTDKVYGDAELRTEGTSLLLTLQPAKELLTGTLEHWHHDTWKWNHVDPFLEPGYITFHFDTDHKVKHFTIDLYSPDFHFYKLEFKKP